jgi:fibronectin-binding autotransporter adhesin
MLDQARPHCLPLLAALILGLGLTWAMLALLNTGSLQPGGPPVARAANDVRYVAPNGADSSNPCTDGHAPCATLQHAVDVANPGDEIRVASGTYAGVQARAGMTQVAYISKTVTIRGGYTTTNWTTSDSGSNPTTFDAQSQGRVFFIARDPAAGSGQVISPTIEKLRITGGNAGASGLTGFGGGVYIVSASATLSHNQVFSNIAASGGGVYLDRSVARLNGNIINSNTADFCGGLCLHNASATLSGNAVTSNTAIYDGGGLGIDSSQATFNNNTISANVAGYNGGGLALYESAVVLDANTVTVNIAGQSGGGLYLSYNNAATLSGNTIIANAAYGDGLFVGGGGLYLYTSDATLSGNTIASNTTAYVGGGLCLIGGTVTLSGSTIISNTANLAGGGLSVDYGNLTFNNNIVVANAANYGGGLLLESGFVTMTNNVVAANQAITAGSGLLVWDALVHMLHTTIAHNTGGDGSGIHFIYSSGPSTVWLTNTILTSQTIGITTTSGSITTLTGVLWFGNGANTDGSGTIILSDEYTGNPAFVADGYHLNAGSAAINRGIKAGVTTDIDGQSRDTAPDLGADEYPLAEKVYLPIVWRNQ